MHTCPGDHHAAGTLGLDFPADLGALIDGGARFLTAAFRSSGALDGDNAVARVEDVREFRGGSTGRKALLSVAYRTPCELPRDLFVKFSRDFDDPARDLGRHQMADEVRFALLTRTSSFPIAVPRCLYADYHAESGTGILITERIPFGTNGIERQYQKCADHDMPDPVAHYLALFSALGRLAGSAKAGHLGTDAAFKVDIRALSVGERAPYTPEQLGRRVDRLVELAQAQPNLLPANVVSEDFLSTLRRDVGTVADRIDALWDRLSDDRDYIALCHWNANVDNAWFWREAVADGQTRLRCGLMDWGCVGQMNLAMAIWGAMCSAETSMWSEFDMLSRHFLDEYSAAGGPRLDPAVLRDHVLAYVAIMGTTWLLDVPGYLLTLLPEPVADRSDPRIADSEQTRSRLLMMTNFLNLFQTWDVRSILDDRPGS